MQYATGAALIGLVIAFVLFLPNSLAQWLKKKNYQYEVTFSLYMLTPTEKFVFSMSLMLSSPTPEEADRSSRFDPLPHHGNVYDRLLPLPPKSSRDYFETSVLLFRWGC
jgi:hypothetical protein